MLAHAASAQGISAVENMNSRPHVLNHLSVPAACFTHPEVSFVGLTEEAAREKAEAEGWADKVAVSKTSFKANSKVIGDGICVIRVHTTRSTPRRLRRRRVMVWQS